MNKAIIAVVIVGLVVIGALVTSMVTVEAEEPVNPQNCGGGCREGNSCSNPECGIQQRKTCGCGQ